MKKIRSRPSAISSLPESAYFAVVVFLAAVIAWSAWISFGAEVALNLLSPTKGSQLSSAISLKSPNPNGGAQMGSSSPSQKDPGQPSDSLLSRLGQSGDSFGGFNALAAAGAFAGVLWSGTLQRRSLTESRRLSAYIQAESAVFRMLDLVERRLPDIQFQDDASKTKVTYKGFEALNVMARYIARNKDLNSLQDAIGQYIIYYNKQPSTLGPFWRTLYQMFKLISDEPISSEQKIRLSKIVRGQLPEGAVFLFALNSQTPFGSKSISLINQFALLKYMHPNYVDKFGADLRNVFEASAFKRCEDVPVGRKVGQSDLNV